MTYEGDVKDKRFFGRQTALDALFQVDDLVFRDLERLALVGDVLFKHGGPGAVRSLETVVGLAMLLHFGFAFADVLIEIANEFGQLEIFLLE